MKISREKKENAGTGLWKYADWVWRFLTGRPLHFITIDWEKGYKKKNE